MVSRANEDNHPNSDWFDATYYDGVRPFFMKTASHFSYEGYVAANASFPTASDNFIRPYTEWAIADNEISPQMMAEKLAVGCLFPVQFIHNPRPPLISVKTHRKTLTRELYLCYNEMVIYITRNINLFSLMNE